jgi:CheY-like chemotaxis protein
MGSRALVAGQICAQGGGVGPRIVIVDDDRDLREALHELLAAMGYEVEAFALASEAIERHGEGGFEIALVDLSLQEIGGLELVRHLRALSVDLGILVYSGRHDLRQAALDAGCDRFILKPSVDELQKALEEWPWSRVDEAYRKIQN